MAEQLSVEMALIPSGFRCELGVGRFALPVVRLSFWGGAELVWGLEAYARDFGREHKERRRSI